ncbi:MAG: hypothetical protein HY298_05590 [Verrucomicrobia bacterium]|nr:hypothetical protein [Verrucomicrobiota bacterium]
MKTIQLLILLAGLSTGISIMAAEPATDATAKDKSAAPAATAVPDAANPALPTSPPTQTAEPAPAATAPSNDTNAEGGLRLNFRGAPLETVLNYLSEAAGFIIVLDTQVKGKVDVWSNQPLSKDEAVNVLNSVLNKNGYAAIRNDRTLTIVNKDEAKTKGIPVVSGGDPETIPRTDEIVTQIIPVRYVEAAQLIKDLQPLVSTLTTMTANESGNSIVITDTRANIHRVAEVIKAIDSSAEDETQVRVFPLKHHDPTEMANLLTGLFSDQGNTGGAQSPFRFGGGGGGRGGGGPGGGGPGAFLARIAAASGGAGAGGQADRLKKRQRVVAVADARTSSVVVTAARDLMGQIETMVEQLDHESPKVSKVSVIHLDNADPQQVQQVLQDMFQSTTTRNRNSSTQTSPFQTRIQQNQNNTATGTGIGTSGFNNTRGR